MTTLRRADRRHHDRRDGNDLRSTFDPQESDPATADRFGFLSRVEESHVPPGANVVSHPRRDSEVITYVCDGSLAFTDSTGRSGVLHGGEFQRMTSSPNVRHDELNPSLTDWLHFYRLFLRPSEADLAAGSDQRRFSAADRRGQLCVVASPDGRRGSLRIHQDAIVYAAILEDGQHLIHELARGRSAWLQIVSGEATTGGFTLFDGDGIGLDEERAVALTARMETEVLLVDLGPSGPVAPVAHR